MLLIQTKLRNTKMVKRKEAVMYISGYHKNCGWAFLDEFASDWSKVPNPQILGAPIQGSSL